MKDLTKPRVEMVRSTDSSEQLVCSRARNDYRSDGTLDHEFSKLMRAVEPSSTELRRAVKFCNENMNTNLTYTESNDLESYPRYVQLEAKKWSLLKDLITSGHWGPFEHPQATIQMEGVTRVSMAQITRHRHFTFDIMSLRYVGLDEEPDHIEERFQIPRMVSTGSGVTREGKHDINKEVAENIYIDAYEDCMEHYWELLRCDVPQEEARKVLPMGTKVNISMSGNARAWMHLLNIRGKADVQGEARMLADQIMEEMKNWMPLTFEYYDEEVLPLKLNP